MQKWEYLFIDEWAGLYKVNGVSVGEDDVGEAWNYANLLGKEGWELVTAARRQDSKKWDLVFKRPTE